MDLPSIRMLHILNVAALHKMFRKKCHEVLNLVISAATLPTAACRRMNRIIRQRKEEMHSF